ncbi:protein ENHANCED DOWNY MILDEW 2-like isoform X2 [Mangifera indica]|nr:protein ENHANCED DOWNY MILDEW 2-like isoform X2 [Mangifera indica]XP_044495111.1 protein ENHANCED DOWNY MILDEW 2-like isoform X2 [Mangifera indica]
MMASSDDESEVGPVSNYNFVDEKDEPVSFSVLPVQWDEDENATGNKMHIFLDGTADNGLQKIYKRVVGWRFDLTNENPEIYVLSKEKSWIKLQKPRKSFEKIIRTILITVHCLSYAKRNPEATGKSIWDHLSKVFSLHEVRPSQNDLVDHMDLVSEALKRDVTLAKSKFLLKFLEEKPRKRRLSDEDLQSVMRSSFIVDDQDDMIDDGGDDDSNKEEDLFDTVCSICDNGGELLCCEKGCKRSFHATVEDGEESQCVSLGLTKDEVDAIRKFSCKNCEYKQHQCFICGKLGSSEKASGAEVFRCDSASCGRFYHPHCVSKWLLGGDEVAVKQFQESIFSGESFICPIHKCYVCKQFEIEKDIDLQFALCRRCPKAYHRKCLPRDIVFEGEEEDGVIARAWEGLLPNRILIYCTKHEIDEDMGTPIRDHISFPGMELKKTIFEGLKQKQTSAIPATKEKFVSMKSTLNSIACTSAKPAVNVLKRFPSVVKQSESTRKIQKLSGGSDQSMKIKAKDAHRKNVKETVKSVLLEVDRSYMPDAKKTSLSLVSELQKSVSVKPTKMKLSELPSLDAETERRLLSLMKDAASKITLKDIQKRLRIPSTHTNSLKAVVDKAISMEKVEGSVEAVRTALKKLEEEGSSIEDSKAVCEPEVVNQIFKWKSKLKVYLAPFFHAARYTSFGRHFTKTEKLQEIVDKLHWYVQDGDMIVDFCCGANEFSSLLKKKLEETGKRCFYKNFDILQAKNNFNFEKRDWMTVKPQELAPGSQLIMGLNPPFGVKAALANKFINKALEFNPKLLILIVPPEAERLDKKTTPYVLVWEDDLFLTGKSFYLPGSVDEKDKQMDQWNLTVPPLYLWSHPDWAAGHKVIAEKHGHISRQQEASDLGRNCNETHILDHPMEDVHCDDGDAFMATDLLSQNVRGDYVETSMWGDLSLENILGHFDGTTMMTGLPQNIEMEVPMQISDTDEGNSPDKTSGGESNGGGSGENQSRKASMKRERDKKAGRGMSEKSSLDRHNVGRNLGSETYKGIPQSPPASMIDGRSSVEQHMSKCAEIPSHVGFGENGHQHFDEQRLPHCSPANVFDRISMLEGHSSRSTEVPPHAGLGNDGYHHFGDKGMSYHSSLNMIQGMPSLDSHPSKSIDIPSCTGFGNNSYRHFEPTTSGSHMQFGTAYHGNTQPSFPDGTGWRYGMNNNESDLATSPPRYGQMGAFLPPTFGHLGSIPESSYRMNMSTMDQYNSQLGGANHQSVTHLRSEPPMLPRTSFNDLRAPPDTGFPSGMGFASGPYEPGTQGWLDP